jgi:hypothetical protein
MRDSFSITLKEFEDNLKESLRKDGDGVKSLNAAQVSFLLGLDPNNAEDLSQAQAFIDSQEEENTRTDKSRFLGLVGGRGDGDNKSRELRFDAFMTIMKEVAAQDGDTETLTQEEMDTLRTVLDSSDEEVSDETGLSSENERTSASRGSGDLSDQSQAVEVADTEGSTGSEADSVTASGVANSLKAADTSADQLLNDNDFGGSAVTATDLVEAFQKADGTFDEAAAREFLESNKGDEQALKDRTLVGIDNLGKRALFDLLGKISGTNGDGRALPVTRDSFEAAAQDPSLSVNGKLDREKMKAKMISNLADVNLSEEEKERLIDDALNEFFPDGQTQIAPGDLPESFGMSNLNSDDYSVDASSGSREAFSMYSFWFDMWHDVVASLSTSKSSTDDEEEEEGEKGSEENDMGWNAKTA